MPNLEAQAAWQPVREIGIELARGGPNGNMNEQAKALLARTEFLNQEKASKSEIVQGVFEFGTYAEFNAAKENLPLNSTVVIGEENTTGTGTWKVGNNRWNGSTLTASSFDPIKKANQYTDSELESAFEIKNPNLFLRSKKISARYINTTGSVATNNTTEMVAIQVEAGAIYSIQSPNFRSDAFYAAYGISDTPVVGPQQGLVVFTDSPTQAGVKQFTVPAGVSYIYLNTLLPNFSFDIRNGVILNKGNTISDAIVLKIKSAKIFDNDALHKTDISGVFQLYNPANNVNNKFVRYNTGNIETSASATVMNVFPVVGGETYSIQASSYANAYFAIAFRDSASSANGATLSLANLLGSGEVRQFTAPEGATHAFINIILPSGGFDISLSLKINKGNSIVDGNSIDEIDGKKLIDVDLREIVKDLPSSLNVESHLKGKKWLAIGDSITHKNDRSHFNYHYYLAQDVGGMTVYNYGISGSGFFSRYSVADTITQTDIDFVTVFLGTNDWGNQTTANQKQLGVFGDTGTTTISGCINTTLQGLINKFPLIPIAIFTPLPRATNYGLNAPDNAYGYNLKDLVELLHEYAAHYSLPILDLYTISNLYPWLPASNEHYFKPFEGSSYGTNPDGLHPNDAGHMLLARKMKLFLESL